jgi:hypothetical protein
MGKFGSNRSNNRGFGGSRRGNDDGESRSESRGGGYNRRSGGGKSRRNEDDSLKLGDISVSEKVAEDIGEGGLDDLRDAGISAYVKVYPPKGVDEIVIKRGDYINIRICKSKHGKERTIGFMTVSSND